MIDVYKIPFFIFLEPRGIYISLKPYRDNVYVYISNSFFVFLVTRGGPPRRDAAPSRDPYGHTVAWIQSGKQAVKMTIRNAAFQLLRITVEIKT